MTLLLEFNHAQYLLTGDYSVHEQDIEPHIKIGLKTPVKCLSFYLPRDLMLLEAVDKELAFVMS